MTTGNAQNESNRQATEKQIDNKDNEINTFKDEMKVNLDETQQENKTEQIDYDKIMIEILDRYKEEYGVDLKLEDLSYIKSNPQFLGIDDKNTYIQDYKEETPVQEHISEGIKDIYVIINNNDNKIISSLGKVNENIVNIDTKVVMDFDRNEYFESDKKIDLTENKNLSQIKQTYEAVEHQYEQEKEQQEEKGR